ncbi:MAG: FlaA1/EpsC-like NDP-sugar epimerase [Candidatus Azotimanducaceae bacterium]|jgi:FlaA1/EpsC-like NDP-sugar epimerase
MENRLSERSKRTIMMFADAVMLPVALWVSIVLRYGDLYMDMMPFWWMFLLVALVGIAALYKFGFYRAIVRYIGPSSMVPVIQGVTVSTVAIMLAAYFGKVESFPRSAPVIFWFISILFVGGSRLAVRAYFYGWQNNYLTREPVAIYGAGDSGAQLAITLLSGSQYMPVAFIDDNRELRKNVIHGVRVYDSAHVDRLINEQGVKQVFLAIPSATIEQRSRILNNLASLPVQVKTVPSFSDLIFGSASVNEVREIDISDLLGREMVPAAQDLLESSVKGKAVLVTGAGGTIGSELCRQIKSLNPSRLVLFDNSEFALYRIENELRDEAGDVELLVLLGSILNEEYLSKVMNNFEIDTVYHAAAFKHVPMVEANVIEGVRNNVVGTWNVVKSAQRNQVAELVLVSSDKAVRPTNVMGATKRLGELIVQAYASKSEKTRYSMVRFGNVLRSSGSVVPLFERQIKAGGPVTVTHKDTTRYFMTASEAAELVIQAGALAEGGELFVLDMGEPVSIHELAVKMIHLHGKALATVDDAEDKIAIEFTGLRPGEKLHEELIIGQTITGTKHPKIMRAEEEGISFTEMQKLCEQIEVACASADYKMIRMLLEENVSGYKMHALGSDPVMKLDLANQAASNVTPIQKSDD